MQLRTCHLSRWAGFKELLTCPLRPVPFDRQPFRGVSTSFGVGSQREMEVVLGSRSFQHLTWKLNMRWMFRHIDKHPSKHIQE